MSETVVIIGAGSALAGAVAARAAGDPAVGRVVLVGSGARVIDLPGGVEWIELDLDAPEVAGVLGGAASVVVLGHADEIGPDGLPDVDLLTAERVLQTAVSGGVGHLVVLSSAMVYGAWANNPVPLTEEAPLRPDPGLAYGSVKAEVERRAFEWRRGRPDAPTVAVLRAVISVDAGSAAWLAGSPWSAGALRASGIDRPSQYLHLDDLVEAIDHARRLRLDGPYNVAPDGWLPPDALRELAGPVSRVNLPAGVAARLQALRVTLRPAGARPEAPYTRHPWVVANDRLRATGWEPVHRNEEVYVEADPGGPLASLSPRRRQELSLGVAAALLVGGVAAVILGVRRRRRR